MNLRKPSVRTAEHDMAEAERKRGNSGTYAARKLLINEKVEVRSTEEGLQGSWHRGQVIGFKDEVRRVMYDDLLNDEGLGEVEDVQVSPVLDGIVRVDDSTYRRGKIQPVPPPFVMHKGFLHYGLCVDVFVRNAWWEGVIYDHNDDSNERRVFFPDQGDEESARIEALRITRDWDEASEGWKIRGKWVLLEILEDVESYWPLSASVRQVWYEIQVKLGSEMVIMDWTYPSKGFWKEVLGKVLVSSYDLLMRQITYELRSTGEFESQLRNLPAAGFQFTPRHEDILSDSEDEHVTVSSASSDSSESPCMIDLSEVMGDEVKSGSTSFPVLPPFVSILARDDSAEAGDPGTSEMSQRWSPAESGFNIVPRYSPGSILEYLGSRQEVQEVRRHLVFLRWRIETAMFGRVRKWRYISPDGRAHYSLRQVCLMLDERPNDNARDGISNTPRFLEAPVQQLLMASNQLTHARDVGLIASPVIDEPVKKQVGRRDDKVKDKDKDTEYGCIEFEKEFNLKAVEEYTELGGSYKSGRLRGSRGDDSLILKARKHLSAVGWTFHYVKKQWNNKDKREMRYVSPGGRTFISLMTACKSYLAEGRGDFTPSSVQMEASTDNALLDRPEKMVKGAFVQQPAPSPPLGSRNDGPMLLDSRDDFSVGVQPTRMVLSQEAASSSSHQIHPRRILPRLIDGNVVSLGAKVQYRNKGGLNMKEGRIIREGIVCICCAELFSLSRFEAHAGSTYHRPSAYIFLEDGRSIADCQVQLHSEKHVENAAESGSRHNLRALSDNDYICSVCHNEGDLILCDQCPSSFHTGCLGLKDVPEGDWFCPSCCCRICNLVSIKHYKEEPSEESYLCCGQCEHRYHIRCLRSNGLIQPDFQPGANWFCSSRCAQIHLGLQDLLRKPIHVGRDNLVCTWLKYKHIGAPESEHLAEGNRKLSSALSIMHECFEPVKEACSGRDIVHDAIFNEWSDLHRLNFQGFYTVTLERNGEIITVALVRIHGQKVAEMPLVATGFQYRRMGMCRVLMNELEKKLMELGVERLILPAAPSVLETWEKSFGFTRMIQSERLSFLGCTFLDFQGAIMCQKLLQNTPSSGFRQPPECVQKLCDNVVHIDSDKRTGNYVAAQVKQATTKPVDHPLREHDKVMEEWDARSNKRETPEMPQTDELKSYKRRKSEITTGPGD